MSEYIIGISAEVIERAKNGEKILITPKLTEVVRCRDCNSYEQRKDGGYCHHFSMFDRAGWPVEPSGFCAWAERRTDDN